MYHRDSKQSQLCALNAMVHTILTVSLFSHTQLYIVSDQLKIYRQ